MKITCTDRLKDHLPNFLLISLLRAKPNQTSFKTHMLFTIIPFSLFSCCGFQKAKPSCSKLITEIENSCSLSWKRKLGQSFLFCFSKFPVWALPGRLLELA